MARPKEVYVDPGVGGRGCGYEGALVGVVVAVREKAEVEVEVWVLWVVFREDVDLLNGFLSTG